MPFFKVTKILRHYFRYRGKEKHLYIQFKVEKEECPGLSREVPLEQIINEDDFQLNQEIITSYLKSLSSRALNSLLLRAPILERLMGNPERGKRSRERRRKREANQ